MKIFFLIVFLLWPTVSHGEMALVFQGKVVQIVPDGQDFPVSPALKWVSALPSVRVGWSYNGVAFTPPPPPPPIVDSFSQVELEAAIRAATTLGDLKSALLGESGRGGRISGRD